MAPKKSKNNLADPIAQEVKAILSGVNLSPENNKSEANPAKPETKLDFIIPEEDDETTSDSSEETEEETDPGVPPDEPDLPTTEPISGSFDLTEDGDIEAEDKDEDKAEAEGPVSLDDDEYEPKEDDTQPHDFADELKQAERRRQALINRLTKKFGPDVIKEIQEASEALNEESMKNLLLQYWAEDQEFKADDEIRLAQERLNKKSWKQKIAESRTIVRFFPVGSAILGAGLGIVGSVVARTGANILIKKALMNTVHHGLGEATAFITGGTFGAIKGYLHEKERRRDAHQLLQDIVHASDSSNIDGVGGLQLINEAIKDGLKGDQETMQRIFDWQTYFRFKAINEHQLGALAEQGLEQVERGKAANEVILDNLAELLDRQANLEFKESKKKFKKTYDRGWQQMGKKIGKGALAGGITSLAAYELAHLIADAIGNIWDHDHPAATTPPAALAPELAQAPSQPTAPEVSPAQPAIEAPSTSPLAEPSLPQPPIEATPEAPLIPESAHHITNPTDYARDITIKDPAFQDMVDKFAAGQVSSENGADSILNHHGVKADYEIPKLNGATLSDKLQEFVQANHDKLKDPETAQAVYRAVYHLSSHPTLFIDYPEPLSAEDLASDWHNLSQSLSADRGDDIVKNVDKFIDSQRQLWNGDHLPKDIAEEFIKTQQALLSGAPTPVVDAESVGITAPDTAASVTSAAAPSLSSEPSSLSTPSNPSAPFSTPVSFWQSPIGNGLKALGCIGAASSAGVGLHYRNKKQPDKQQTDQPEQSSQPDQPNQQAEPSEKSKHGEAKQESNPVKAEIVYNKPETIEEFIKFVQEDLELKLQDLPVNSIIMRLTTGAVGRNVQIELSPEAENINLGNLAAQSFTTGNLGNIALGKSKKILLPDGESTTVYEVGNHVVIRDVDKPTQQPDFSKPGQFEFYYIK